MPVKDVLTAPGYFAHPDPVGPPVIPATTVPADFLNTVAEEGKNLIEAVGLTLSKTVDYQWRDAVFGVTGAPASPTVWRNIPGAAFNYSTGSITNIAVSSDPTVITNGGLNINNGAGSTVLCIGHVPDPPHGMIFSGCHVNLSALGAGNAWGAVVRKHRTTGACSNLSTQTPAAGEALGAGVTALTLDEVVGVRTVDTDAYAYFVWIYCDAAIIAVLESATALFTPQ